MRALLAQARAGDVNAAGVDGMTALHWAVRADRRDMAEPARSRGSGCTARNRYGITPLYLAAVNGNADMIRMLLDAGADPNGARADRVKPR